MSGSGCDGRMGQAAKCFLPTILVVLTILDIIIFEVTIVTIITIAIVTILLINVFAQIRL